MKLGLAKIAPRVAVAAVVVVATDAANAPIQALRTVGARRRFCSMHSFALVNGGSAKAASMDKVPDSSILKKVNENLQRTGSGGQAKIQAGVRNGEVTLSGSLQYEMQRSSMMKAANSVAGVRRVIDKMSVSVTKRATH